jgi:sugar phosphate permease
MDSASLSKTDISNEVSVPEENKSSTQAWAILACGWIFYLYEYILRASTGVITDALMSDFGISALAVGSLAGLYYFAYVPLQVPCGVIVDNLGPRRVISFSAFLCITGSLLFATSESLFIAQVGRIFIGAGSACAYISCMKIASEWFHSSKFAMIAGVSMMMGTFGGIFGGKPFAYLANTQGWRNAMLLTALVGVLVMVFSWIIVRDRPSDKPKQIRNENLLDGLKIIIAKPQNWLIGLYGLVMYLPLSAFAELWGVPYLMQRFSIDNEQASYGTLMVFIGYAVGCALSAWLSDKWSSRKKVMSISVTGTFFGFIAVLYLPVTSYSITLALLFLTGAVSGLSILYFAAAKESNSSEISATIVGFTNALVMVSGLVFQPLLGALIDYSWNGTFNESGAPAYNFGDYQFALGAVVFSMLVGRLIVHFINETYPSKEA